ncbi:hypothetical protein [Intestinimonas timonensis]
MEFIFSKDMCLGKNTAQPASVRAQRVRRSRLHLFEKMLAFLREPAGICRQAQKRRQTAALFSTSNIRVVFIRSPYAPQRKSGFPQGFSTFSTGLSTYVYVNVEKWIIHIGRHKTTVKGKLRGIFAKFTKDHKDTET